MQGIVRSRSWTLSAVIVCNLAATVASRAGAEDDAATLARLRREIAETVGDNGCGNASFCRVIPMGHDACGNPTEWVAFNNYPGVREVVETKAAEYTFVEEEMRRGEVRPRDCKPAVAVKPACVNNRCAAGGTSY